MTMFLVERPEGDYEVHGDDVVVRDGCLVFVNFNEEGQPRANIVIAAGHWILCGRATRREALPPPKLVDKAVN